MMKILAIDTATENCSVALRVEGKSFEREVLTQRTHAELVLPMVDELLRETTLKLRDLDGIAYGRGPGAFTGVRVAVVVVQGLAFGAGLPTVGISNLAAVAHQVIQPNATVLVCMDARMSEVYSATYAANEDGRMTLRSAEGVMPPSAVVAQGATILAGTGFRAYPELRARFPELPVHDGLLPHARDIAALAEARFRAGEGVPAAQVLPTYLRDRVTFVKEL